MADWRSIQARKQKLIDENNERENAKRLDYDYQVGDQILMQRLDAKKAERPYDGPFTVHRVHTNGTITIRKGPVLERINNRRAFPYKSQSNQGSECNVHEVSSLQSS